MSGLAYGHEPPSSEGWVVTARTLAERRKWPALWEFLLSLRPADAVRVAGMFGDAWRPADGPGRLLFGRLVGAGPEMFSSLVDAPVRSIQTCGAVRFVVFGPGPAEIAVGEKGVRPGVGVYDTASGSLERRHRTMLDAWLDSPEVVVAEVEYEGGGSRVVRRTRQRKREVLLEAARAPTLLLAFVPGGFVVASGKRLFRGGQHGPLREVPLPPLPWMEQERPGGIGPYISELAADRSTGRIALTVSYIPWRLLAVLDADLTLIGSTGYSRFENLKNVYWLGFCGPSRLITLAGYGTVTSWRLQEHLTPEATTEYAYPDLPDYIRDDPEPLITSRPDLSLEPLPSGHVAVYESRRPPRYLDAQSLTPASSPPWLHGPWVSSPDPYRIACWQDRQVDVRDTRLDTLHTLATEPMANAKRADMPMLTAASALPGPHEGAVSLIRECLEYRFKT